jgi:DNA excision repair protein ERCC-2
MVTTTYHYVFDEASRSLLFTSAQFEPSKTIVIFDEAHNLRDFIRGISTVTLSVGDLERSVNESKELYLESVHDALCILKTRIQDFCSASKAWFVDKESFLKELCKDHDKTWLANLSFELSTSAGVAWYSISTERILPHSILAVGKFLTALLSSLTEENQFLTNWQNSLSIINVDVARFFVETTRKFKTTVLLSATVSPSELFLRSIGLPGSTRLHKTEPNASLRITTLLDLGVTTKFRLRSDEMYSKIASRIVTAASMRPGGIGVFTPSYTVLEALLPFIEKGIGSENLIVESKKLTNQEAGEIMESFKQNKDSVLLAVQGGRFSEGEDFRGDLMNISVVVGLSLPPPSPSLFAEYSYLGKSDRNNSYLLVSLLPALRKAFQSAGRHIRTPNKKGLVFLLDSRFSDQRIIDLMPSWLKRELIQKNFSSSEIQEIVRDLNLNRNPS